MLKYMTVPNYYKIIIPSSLHPDTILGIFLLKKFGSTKYPGIENAEIEIRQALQEGETSDSLKEKGIICLDVGGGDLDHHQKGKILSELVSLDVGVMEDPAILKLLAYAERDDKHGVGTISTDQLDRTFGLSGLISSLNKTTESPARILDIVFPLLEAHYLEERKRTSELPQEFEKYLRAGKAEIFEVKQRGKKLKIVALESDNVSMPGWLKSSIGLKADVVCQRKTSGYTNILTKQFKRVDLRWLAAYLRDEELQLKGKNIEYPPIELMKPGKLESVSEWYYDRATNSLVNGGANPKGVEPTKISITRIKEAMREALPRYMA